MTLDDLTKWADFNRSFLEYVSDGKKAGKTVDEMAKAYTAPAGFQPLIAGHDDASDSERPDRLQRTEVGPWLLARRMRTL